MVDRNGSFDRADMFGRIYRADVVSRNGRIYRTGTVE